MSKMRKCMACGRYTFKESCPGCNSSPTATPHPAKFSPQDAYAKYRRAMKKEAGLL